MVKPGLVVLIGLGAVVVFGSVLFVPGSTVLGQVPTTAPKTATITAPAPYQVATYAAVVNSLSCPIGRPAGWGTVTPGASWDFLCGQCFFTPAPTTTAIVTPTAGWMGTGTPPAQCTPFAPGTGTPSAGCVVNTPMATITNTPMATGTPNSCGNLSVAGAWGQTPVEIDNASGIYASYTSDTMICSSSSGVLRCQGSITVTDTSNGADGGVQVGIKIINTSYMGTVAYSMSSYWTTSYFGWGANGQSGTNGGASIWNSSAPSVGYYGGGHTVGGLSSGSGNFTVNNSFDYGWLKIYVPCHYYAGTQCRLTVDISISVTSNCLLAPTPTGTAAPTTTSTPNPNYCGTVQTAASDRANSQIFSYSGFQVGATSCFDLGGPGFQSNNYDLGTLLNGVYQIFASDPTNWLAHICLSDLNIGVVKIFAMSINLHIFAFFAAIGLLVRNMFIS